MLSYDTYIFDLDGTLLNTIDDLATSCNYALQSFGMPQHSVDEVRQFVGNGVKKLIERAVPDGVSNPHFEAVLSLFREHYLQHNTDSTRPYRDIPELLSMLRRYNKHVAVVSNKFCTATQALVDRYFEGLVDVAIGESEDVRKKPAPDMVNEVLRILQQPSDTAVYIGDSEVDIETAQNSGLPCISVLWGFRDMRFLTAHGASTFVNNPLDILSI